LSNHALLRNIDRFPWCIHKTAKARVAAMLLLTLKGTPFIYYGEEIGMHNTRIGKRDIHDPMGKRYWPFFAGRDKARTPMQWGPEAGGGFTKGKPWLPLNDDTATRNVKMQEGDSASLLNLYRNLIRIRRERKSLYSGEWNPLLNGKNGVLAYFRTCLNERTLVILNFTGIEKTLSLPDYLYGKVLLSVHRSPDEYFYFQNFMIFPYEATIFQVDA
jgi:alpha-glucosidase